MFTSVTTNCYRCKCLVMDEEGDTPAEAVQSASRDSLSDELSPKSDKLHQDLRSVSNIGHSPSRFETILATIAQVCKMIVNWLFLVTICIVCFNFKNEIAKSFLALAMNPIAIFLNAVALFFMDNLIKRELELNSMKIETMERKNEDVRARLELQLEELTEKMRKSIIEIDRIEGESDTKLTSMKNEIKLKAKEIECLKQSEDAWKSQVAQLKEKIKVSKMVENIKTSGEYQRGIAKLENKLSSIIDRATEMTIRARFPDISQLMFVSRALSKQIEFAGLSWRIRVSKTTDGYLAIHLKAEKSDAARWSCTVVAVCQLISQQDGSVVKQYASEQPLVYNDKQTSCGCPRFIPFGELLNGDAVRDDSIIVAVAIKIFPTN